jgi:GTP-binding protein EngB required for normal cell division
LLLPVIPLILWWNFRRDEKRFLAGVLEVARLRQVVLHRVTIGVVGSPSTGKDAAIKALFGIDTGNVSPIAGSTKEVAIQRLPTSTALYVVNTPGMGDVVERVTEEARQVLDHIDVFLYIVNAEGGVQQRELEDYRRCLSRGRPVLVLVNKIDVLREHDREAYLADARAKLGAPPEDFQPVAVDPLPQLSPVPIGLDAVHAWLRLHLTELGKDPDELPPLPVPTPRVPMRDPLLDELGEGS